MADRILLVCTANECRSPYAMSVLHSMLAAAGSREVAVVSAGFDVLPGHRICAEVARRSAALGVQPEHRARPLHTEDVESASLVLVAERRHRAAIVRMSPSASARTFTLTEAAALGTVRRHDAPSAWDGSVEAFAARLHEARGLIPPIELDIADGHHGTPREHRRALDEVGASASAIANAMLGRQAAALASRRARPSWQRFRIGSVVSTLTPQRRDAT